MKKSTMLTLLFVLIFLIGTLGFVAYINYSLNNSHSVENTGSFEEINQS